MLRLHSSLYVWSSVNVTKKGRSIARNQHVFYSFSWQVINSVRSKDGQFTSLHGRNWTLIGIELWSLSLFGPGFSCAKLAMIHITSLYDIRMQDAPGFLECFLYSVQFLFFVCLESHLFRVLCTGNGGVLHWNHFLAFALQKHPARCCAQKNAVAMVSKMLQHLQEGMKREVPFGKLCDFIEKKIQEWDSLLLELQEKLSNNWAIGRPTIALCSWRWDQIRVKVSILNLHIWMLTLLWGIRRGEWGSAGALSWVHFALEILEESSEGSVYPSLSRFIPLIWKVSLLEVRNVIWWGSQWAFIGTLLKQYEAISQGFWTSRIHWVNLGCENSTLPPEVEWDWRSTAFLAVHVLGARCRCVSIWVTERVPCNAKVETHM